MNLEGRDGTALQIAAKSKKKGRRSVIRLLLEHGATWPDGVCPEKYRHLLEDGPEQHEGQDWWDDESELGPETDEDSVGSEIEVE